MPAQRDAVVLHAEVRHAGAVAPEVGDERVVGVEDERACPAPPRRPPPSGRRSSRARRSGRAGRGRGWRAAARAGAARARPGRARTRRPRRAPRRRRSTTPRAAPSSAVVTPPAMFAPARLWTSRAPSPSRIAATIAAVVVLPLVAEITALPSRRRAGQPRHRLRLEAHEQLAGQARPAAPAAARQRPRGARDGDLRLEHHRRGRASRGARRSRPGRGSLAASAISRVDAPVRTTAPSMPGGVRRAEVGVDAVADHERPARPEPVQRGLHERRLGLADASRPCARRPSRPRR